MQLTTAIHAVFERVKSKNQPLISLFCALRKLSAFGIYVYDLLRVIAIFHYRLALKVPSTALKLRLILDYFP